MAATTTTVYPTSIVSSSKAAEIYREDNGRIYYVCFHCGFDSDNIADTLVHIDIHFGQNDIQPVVDIKCELFDESSYDAPDLPQLEQIFIDCGTRPISNTKDCLPMDTSDDVVMANQQNLSEIENLADMEGLFEWECLHCCTSFKKCTKLKQHLKKHANDPVLKNGKVMANYAFKCTLCSSEFYDSISSEQHLKDLHAAPPSFKCIPCCKKFKSADSLEEHMAAVHRNGSDEVNSKVLRTERNEMPFEATKKHSVCILCDRTFIGTLELMQHTFGHFNLKMFSCPECPSNFQRLTTFNEHMKRKHLLKLQYEYFCRLCDDNVDHCTLFEFVTHGFMHHLDDGDRDDSHLDAAFKYVCRFCPKTFNKWKDGPLAHLKLHTEDQLPKGAPTITNGRSLTDRAKSGQYRSEFLYNCTSCNSTMCGSFEARKHRITVHGITELFSTNHRVVDLQPLSEPVMYRVVSKERTEKTEIRNFQCLDCDTSYDTQIYLMRHRLTHFNVQPYSCHICSKSFYSSASVTGHMTKDHGQKQYVSRKFNCKFCTAEFSDDSDFIKHNFDDHLYANFNIGENLDGLCKYECMASIHAKLTHRDEHQEPPPKNMETPKRDGYCDLWRSMVNHRAKLHPETIKRHTESMPKTNADPVKTNQKKRTTPDGNQCSICNITFLNNRSMLNHRTKRHPETVEKPKGRPIYHCEICGKGFRERSNFNNHTETHAKLHWFTCDICHKSYRLKNSLQTHMLIHVNEKNFVCETCGKSFYTTSKLNLHKQVHENLTFQCEKCDKLFYTRNNFSKHKKTHIENVRKKCEVCDNTFKSSVSLRVHMMLHENKKRYACRYCDMTFSQSSGRRGHEKTRHSFV